MKKRVLRGGAYLLLLFSFLMSFQIVLSENVSTEMEINYSPSPPILLNTIPDQTWAVNTNLTNAFDLDDYFVDNETLTYVSSSVENITVYINSTNEVSFYSQIGFEGVRTVVFNASDGITTTSSNIVTLNVIPDNSPPTWSNLAKDTNNIYQNTIVTFSADWQDNLGLGHYIFSIYQNGLWVNKTPVSFSGTSATSSHAEQISGSAGTTVYWKFYGFDASGNMNTTDTGEFIVGSLSTPPSSGDDDDDDDESSTIRNTSSAGGLFSGKKIIPELKHEFLIEPSTPFKIDIKQGAIGTVSIKITNTGNSVLNSSFSIKVLDFEEFKTILSEEEFKLVAGASKAVTVEFIADKRLRPDLYYGSIEVKAFSRTKKVPVIIQVNPLETKLDLELSIQGESKTFRPKEVVKANITLTNLKDINEKEMSLYYAITDFEGIIIDSHFEEHVFDKRFITFEKEFTLPEKIKKGDYLFFARVISEGDIIIDSELFEIGEKFSVAGFIQLYYLFFLLVILSMAVSILMVRHIRSKERLRLLNLYLLLTELHKLVKDGKSSEAIEVYVKIKSIYGEPVSKTALQNKEELKKEIEKLADRIDEKVLKKMEKEIEKQEGEKQDDEKEDKSSGEENKSAKKETTPTKDKSKEKSVDSSKDSESKDVKGNKDEKDVELKKESKNVQEENVANTVKEISKTKISDVVVQSAPSLKEKEISSKEDIKKSLKDTASQNEKSSKKEVVKKSPLKIKTDKSKPRDKK